MAKMLVNLNKNKSNIMKLKCISIFFTQNVMESYSVKSINVKTPHLYALREKVI